MSMSTAERAYERFNNEITAYEALFPQMNQMALDVEQKLSRKQALIQQEAEDNKLKLNGLANEQLNLEEKAYLLKEKEKETRNRLDDKMELLSQQQAIFANLSNKKQEILQAKKELELCVLRLNDTINEGQLELNKANDYKRAQIVMNVTELSKLHSLAGFRVDVKEPELLSFKFFNLDPNDYDREFTVDLDVGGSAYKITGTNPPLADEIAGKLETELNKTRLVEKFLKNIRNLFKDFVLY